MANLSLDFNLDTASRDLLMISDDIMPYVYTINLATICGILSLFGIATNVINIVVFCNLGFKETINISLLALAISDSCSLLALLWVSICYNPFFMYSKLPILTIDLQHLPGGWTHVMFTRVTGFITVYISIERCLCIAFPLHIKHMMSPRRVTVIVVSIYVVIIGSMLPNYFISYLGWKWVPSLNRTMLGITYTDVREAIEGVTFYIQIVHPISSFSAVVLCTMVFVWKLNRRGKWLQSASGSHDKASTIRDRQIVKLVVCVAVIFIICYIPSVLLFTVLSGFPEVNLGRKYENFFILIYSIAFSLEAVNSSVNVFVYYKMMSKYKGVLHSMCAKCIRPSSSSVPSQGNGYQQQ